MDQSNVTNGVDVDVIQNVVEAMKGDAELAACKFRVHNRWINGGLNRASINGFYAAKQEFSRPEAFVIDADEPPILAGSDLGANPVEHLLRALAGCMMTTMVYYAALNGIEIEELEMDLEGDLDMQGFFGLDDKVRNGYENISVNFKVKADEANLARLKAFSKLSPVYCAASEPVGQMRAKS